MTKKRLIQIGFSKIALVALPFGIIGNGPVRADQPPPNLPAPPSRIVEEQKAALTVTNAPIKMVGPGVFEIGKVTLNQNEHAVSFPAMLNLDHGPMEYFLVNGYGPVHESVLRTDAKPFHIHLAMLLLGARPSNTNDPAQTTEPRPGFISNPGKAVLPGDKISMDLTWLVGDKEITRSAADLIFNSQTKSPGEKGGWVYNGSWVLNGVFQAQSLGAVGSLVTDPDTLINYVGQGHDNDKIWTVNSNALPPSNTLVRVTIKLEPTSAK